MLGTIEFLNDGRDYYNRLQLPVKGKVKYVLYELSEKVLSYHAELTGLMADIKNFQDLEECFRVLVGIAVSIENMKVKEAALKEKMKLLRYQSNRPPTIRSDFLTKFPNMDNGYINDDIKTRIDVFYKRSGIESLNNLWANMWLNNTSIKATTSITEDAIEELNYVEFPPDGYYDNKINFSENTYDDEKENKIRKAFVYLNDIQRSLFMVERPTGYRSDLQLTNVMNDNDDIMCYMYGLRRIITIQRSFHTFVLYSKQRVLDPIKKDIILNNTRYIIDILQKFDDDYSQHISDIKSTHNYTEKEEYYNLRGSKYVSRNKLRFY